MDRRKRPPTVTPATGRLSGVRTRSVLYDPGTVIFSQGTRRRVSCSSEGCRAAAPSVACGKQAVVAVLMRAISRLPGGPVAADGHGRRHDPLHDSDRREKRGNGPAAHAQPGFADWFLTHMLTRNIRIEEDLIDSSSTPAKSGSRARCCCLRGAPARATMEARLPAILGGNPGRHDRHDPLARQLLHEQVPEAGVHRLQRRPEDYDLRTVVLRDDDVSELYRSFAWDPGRVHRFSCPQRARATEQLMAHVQTSISASRCATADAELPRSPVARVSPGFELALHILVHRRSKNHRDEGQRGDINDLKCTRSGDASVTGHTLPSLQVQQTS